MPLGPNVAAFVGHSTVRAHVMGLDVRALVRVSFFESQFAPARSGVPGRDFNQSKIVECPRVDDRAVRAVFVNGRLAVEGGRLQPGVGTEIGFGRFLAAR